MDWLTFVERIGDIEARLMPLRIVRAESTSITKERHLDGVVGGFMVYPGDNDRVWTNESTIHDLS